MWLKSGILSIFVALTLSVLFKLTDLLGAIRYTLENVHQAIDAALGFWGPVLSLAFVLFFPIYLVVYLRWDDANGGDRQGREKEKRRFDQMDTRLQDTETLSTALTQLQLVLDNQLETLADIDDKAVRTVRVQVILLGVIASAAQIASKSIPINIWMKVGGVLLMGSIITGIFTYTVSDGRAGPQPEAVSQILSTHSSKLNVYLRLLEEHREAISENRDILEDNGRYIFYTQLLLVLGILSSGIGVLLATMP